jgi:hypothetical protein
MGKTNPSGRDDTYLYYFLFFFNHFFQIGSKELGDWLILDLALGN